jgi:hypothetical protein
MAGHRKHERTYFVPRTQLQLEHPVEWYAIRLLPKLVDYRKQAASSQGDKSDCCDNFLHEVLPYFVEVLVQDGVFFIRDFPNHPVSLWLKVSFF